MSRYIDADALMKELQEEIDFETPMYTEEQNKYFNGGLRCAIRDVKEQPTADVVEVVRCRDCKHSFRYECENDACYKFTMCHRRDSYSEEVTDDDFCSCGERRAEE